jgi:pyruvate formate-lyase activating enzyme-like uncharacterized protein
MRKIVTWLNESTYIAPLSPACKMCAQGSKMVVLITGLCSAKCFYCPLSTRKKAKDRIFANEWELKDEKDINKLIKEAEYINAKGAGITGGDPLLVWKRTKKYISFLKENFSSDFHIHLYTCGTINGDKVIDLVSAGLDEIRYHPEPIYWLNMDNSSMISSIKSAMETEVDVAIEIPMIPDMKKEVISLINWADKIGIKWINLNEFEFSETNAKELIKKSFTVKNDISAAVKGSQELAKNIIDIVSKKDYEIGIHYCSSSFKDGIQLRNRIKRRAKNVAKKYEIITKDGTLLKGIILSKNVSLNKIYSLLTKQFNIKHNDILKNNEKNIIEIAPWILEKISSKLKKQGFECYIVEQYPTADALEVERTPL